MMRFSFADQVLPLAFRRPHVAHVSAPQRTGLFWPPPAPPAASITSCTVRWLGHGLSATSCHGTIIGFVAQDPVTAAYVSWVLCSGHASRLLTCEQCSAPVRSPYRLPRLCVPCGSAVGA